MQRALAAAAAVAAMLPVTKTAAAMLAAVRVGVMLAVRGGNVRDRGRRQLETLHRMLGSREGVSRVQRVRQRSSSRVSARRWLRQRQQVLRTGL